MTIVLSLFGLALGPAIVAILPASRLPEPLRAVRSETTTTRRVISIARAVVLGLTVGAVVQICVNA